jgi:inner membrane transporter RhtA
MIVGTSVTIQIAAAIAHDLFDRLGPVGASAMRFALGAVILFAIVRPAMRGRDAATWGAIIAYGASLAALNLTFFQAISLIPMGIAVTLSFIPALVMALLRSRRRRDVAWALLAGAGVATLGGIDRTGSVSGVLFALASGCAWVGVAYAGRSVGRRTRRVDGLALAIPIAALITIPLGVEIGHADGVDGRSVALGLVIAVGGLIIPFALELEGLRRLEPRTVAVVYSIDPAIAAVVGWVALGEQLTALQAAALAAVVVASAGATAAAGDSDAPPPLDAHHKARFRPPGGFRNETAFGPDAKQPPSAPVCDARGDHATDSRGRSRTPTPFDRADDALGWTFFLAHPRPTTAAVSRFLLRTGR